MNLTSSPLLYLLLFLVPLYWAVPRPARKWILLTTSYFIYALWDWRFLAVLLGSTALDFFLARWIESARHAKKRLWLLRLSLVSNLGILFFFKYFNFFVETVHVYLPPNPLSALLATNTWIVPLGVSFYTFHSISYIVDVYHRKISACRSMVEYALYVGYFPKLFAGPIERAADFLPQIHAHQRFRWEEFYQAVRLFLLGAFLKFVIAERLATVVNHAYANAASASRLELLLGVYAFSFQIYSDFLAYTWIARGISKLFGFELHPNFRSPYLAQNIQDFWRRWRISLSEWFRDYLYIPLGGARSWMMRNILLTMMLAGLWHGASGKFLLWGLYHGALLVLYRLWNPPTVAKPKWLQWINIVYTFHLVTFGWIFFRAESLAAAIAYGKALLWNPTLIDAFATADFYWLLLRLGFFICVAGLLYLEQKFRGQSRQIPLRAFTMGMLIAFVLLLGARGDEPFIYYHF